MGTLSGPAGFIWSRHRKRDWHFGKQDFAPLLRFSAAWLHRNSCIREWWESSKPKTLYIQASSKNNHQKCLSGIYNSSNSSSKTSLGVQGDLCRSDTKIIAEVTTMGADGNLLRKKRIRFKSTAGFKVFHKMEYLKITKEWPTQEMVDKLRAGYQTESISNDFGNKGIQHVQRSIKAHNQRIEKDRIVRVGRDFQNRSMPNVSNIFTRKSILLQMWCVLYAFAMTNKKDQNSIWDNVCSIPYRERERTIFEWRNTEENDDNMTIGKQKTRQELW